MTRDEMLVAWRNAKITLDSALVTERELRGQVMQAYFADAPEGTHNFELGNGYKLRGVVKFNYSLNRDQTQVALDKIERSGAEGKLLADRLVTFDPRLSVSEWRKLPDKYAKIFAPALTIKPASPTLEIVEPKG